MTLPLVPVPNPDLQFNFDEIAQQFPFGADDLAAGSVGTVALADGAVTPAKRAGGFIVGNFLSHASTGNKAITGVGFTPKFVKFRATLDTGLTNASGQIRNMDGRMDGSRESSDFFAVDPNAPLNLTTAWHNSAIYISDRVSGNTYQASYVSFDSDGFTINVLQANASYRVLWEAYG